jgi:hypothetical protein
MYLFCHRTFDHVYLNFNDLKSSLVYVQNSLNNFQHKLFCSGHSIQFFSVFIVVFIMFSLFIIVGFNLEKSKD